MAENKNDQKKGDTKAAPAPPEKKNLPQLGALEDDDEFEEFAAATDTTTVADTLTANLTEQLWEDNWDDDDVEDDFQKQLRQAIAERAGGDAEMKE
ncbi:uncharacterized protein CcaverHIS019_0101630 [Cutaneotrichosporon cavernicola]|uniref:26S proteasome complex subunit SEM1 n=1 Tax=Cutaneotrichosporon cavernicola TaxID=279322 RepID=A0AA48I401_9TREE|nr:uncharacterized protein CcaverHIS019_0101630 [Cutaneotrichosporon cavernicola]BEI87445.1 hypothetical protein CcaverHIS019_0101630 [Cutaneotrichosporon cavernicola]BEI95214.1 hypothetical protein CcaverHIS631_0101630 [Cutaneotrichosporon cavernicola]BEJ02987.1 hypothetical protein CcaverHIS641_0101620 [Cutaneotrichosporon cavernicola]